MLDELIKVIECLKKRIKEHMEQIQGHHLSSREVIRRTIRMLEHFGQDPSRLLLQLQ